jgi:hypothetical protein
VRLPTFGATAPKPSLSVVRLLHKDLHDLLKMQNEAGARIEKLEAADCGAAR